MVEGRLDAEIARHLQDAPRPPAPVAPADLDRPVERTSADGRVSAAVNGLTLVVESILVEEAGDRTTLGAAVAEAVNAALAAAESGGGPDAGELDRAIQARMAEMDAQLDRITGRLDQLAARLDARLGP